jgi:hypothetical protein
MLRDFLVSRSFRRFLPYEEHPSSVSSVLGSKRLFPWWINFCFRLDRKLRLVRWEKFVMIANSLSKMDFYSQ